MLTAMPTVPDSLPTAHDTAPRSRSDACPGVLRLHRADDGALARVRLPAGTLTAGQAVTLARLSEEYGDGRLDLTSRGNVQLRGLSEDCAPRLTERLRTASLLPSARHDRSRNVVASPLCGLDGAGHADVRSWAVELDGLLCASEPAAALSGRFLFALDDGRGDVASRAADVTLVASPPGQALLLVPAGGEAEGHASSVGLRLAAPHAPRAALVAALEFLAALRRSGTRGWRMTELPAQHRLSATGLTAALAAAGVPSAPVAVHGHAWPSSAAAGPRPGVVSGPDGRCAMVVAAPLGRWDSEQWRLLGAAAARSGTGELRVTPWRGVVLPGFPPRSTNAWSERFRDAGLVTDEREPWDGVGACTGRPGCAKSRSDVRADAARTVREAPSGPTAPVYWSGCERRCGRPPGAYVDVLAVANGRYHVTVRTDRPPSGRTGLTRDGPEPDTSAAARPAGARLADAVLTASRAARRDG